MTKKEVLINHIQEYLDSEMWKYESCYLGKEDLETIMDALKVEPYKDCISRQEALRTDCFGDGYNGLCAFHYYEDYLKMRKYLEQLPSVQPIRPKGKWINVGNGMECSRCHEIQHGYDNYRFFCPTCGADMRSEE